MAAASYRHGWLTLVAGVLGACSGGGSANPPRKPNVVLVVIDTLRADRLSFYGCARENAPFLAGLASKSLVYDRALAPGAWTVPSTASLMTSTYPSQHGVVDGFDFGASDEELADDQVNKIPSVVETMPEMMRALGYRTYGVSANVLVGFEMGFERGFDRFAALDDEVAETVNATVLEWREEMIESDRPTFLYLHYFDPHDPYYQRKPWFDPAGLEVPDKGSDSAFARLRDGAWAAMDADLREDLEQYLPRMLGYEEEKDLPPEAIANPLDWILACYDSEIRYLDEHLLALFDALAIDEQTLVIVTADHGEEFLDHGMWEHGQSFYDELVRVPMMIRLPGDDAPRGLVTGNVSTMDIMPTLRSYLGGRPSLQDRGVDILGTVDESRAVLSMDINLPGPRDGGPPVFPFSLLRSVRTPSRSVAVQRGPWKAIVGDGDLRRSHMNRELFNLQSDPAELFGRGDGDPDVLQSLEGALARIEDESVMYEREFGDVIAGGDAIDAIRRHMEGLGYVDAEDD